MSRVRATGTAHAAVADIGAGDLVTIVWPGGAELQFVALDDDGAVRMLPDPDNPEIPEQRDSGPERRPPLP